MFWQEHNTNVRISMTLEMTSEIELLFSCKNVLSFFHGIVAKLKGRVSPRIKMNEMPWLTEAHLDAELKS